MIKRDKYYIGQYRYYELKYYCLQYKEWEKAYLAIEKAELSIPDKSTDIIDREKLLQELKDAKEHYKARIDMINEVAKLTDEKLSKILILATTENYSYNYLKDKYNLEYSKEDFYELYKKFYFILDNKRK